MYYTTIGVCHALGLHVVHFSTESSAKIQTVTLLTTKVLCVWTYSWKNHLNLMNLATHTYLLQLLASI